MLGGLCVGNRTPPGEPAPPQGQPWLKATQERHPKAGKGRGGDTAKINPGWMLIHHNMTPWAVGTHPHPPFGEHPPKFIFLPSQAAAPAAPRDVPSARRAASAKGPPPPSAAAASRGRRAAPPRRADPGGSRRKLTLFSVFFLYVHSDTFSVWHAWRALSYLNKAMCI